MQFGARSVTWGRIASGNQEHSCAAGSRDTDRHAVSLPSRVRARLPRLDRVHREESLAGEVHQRLREVSAEAHPASRERQARRRGLEGTLNLSCVLSFAGTRSG